MEAAPTHFLFNFPVGLTYINDHLFVADSYHNCIRQVSISGDVVNFAGSGMYGSIDGVGTNAGFSYPRGMASQMDGSLLVVDGYSIRQISSVGVVSSFTLPINTGAYWWYWYMPKSIVVAPNGEFYVSDDTRVYSLRSAQNGIWTILAGGYSYGYVDGLGTTAAFRSASGIALDVNGVIYVADSLNNVIRQMSCTTRRYLPGHWSHRLRAMSCWSLLLHFIDID